MTLGEYREWMEFMERVRVATEEKRGVSYETVDDVVHVLVGTLCVLANEGMLINSNVGVAAMLRELGH